MRLRRCLALAAFLLIALCAGSAPTPTAIVHPVEILN